jgi:3-mercaptopyruvate sulfurtransferase SseA
VAAKLRQHGFTRIRPLLGGLDAWIDAGLPVDGADEDVDADVDKDEGRGAALLG